MRMEKLRGVRTRRDEKERESKINMNIFLLKAASFCFNVFIYLIASHLECPPATTFGNIQKLILLVHFHPREKDFFLIPSQ